MSTANKQLLTAMFAEAVERYPERVAVEQGDERLTYRELDDASERLAAELRRRGVDRDVIVALYLDLSPSYLAGLLAVLKARGVFMPVRTDLPEGRRQYILSITRPAALIAAAGEAPADAGCPVLEIQRHGRGFAWTVDGVRQDLPEQPTRVERTNELNDGLYVFFTSGSSGEPKAVLGRHVSLAHFLHWETTEFDLDDSVRVSGLTSTMLDMSLRDIFIPLLNGGTLCVPTPSERASTAGIVRWFEERRIGLLHIVPSFFGRLMDDSGPGPHCPDLRFLFLAGEPLSGAMLRRWATKLPPSVLYCNFYGPTEATLTKIFCRISPEDLAADGVIKLGRPIASTHILILNARNELCRPREIGEIHIKTAFLSKGYFQDPDLHRQRFIQNPLHHDFEDIVYKTGDLGRYTDQLEVEFCGRADQQVKIRGHRIELGEIECALKRHPEIREAVVLAVGDGLPTERKLVAYVCGRRESGRVEFENWLRHYLPHYMIPAEFLVREQLPLSSNGKIDRQALAAEYARRAVPAGTGASPQTPTERDLLEIWRTTLNDRKLGVDDQFFERGGHSLDVMSVLSAVYRAFRVELSVRDVFDHPTVRGLSGVIDARDRREAEVIPPAPAADDYPLSGAQQRVWIQHELDPSSRTYTLVRALWFADGLEPGALKRALERLVARHESLRTVFVRGDGGPRQKVLDRIAVPLRLDAAPEGLDLDSMARQALAEEGQAPFDLEHGPLLRVRVVRRSDGGCLMLLSVHHLVCDGTSLSVLARDVFHLCGADAGTLPPLLIQYRDYTVWHHERLRGDAARPHRDYWLSKLAGPPEPLRLHTDFPRPPVKSFAGAVRRFALEPRTLDGLRSLARGGRVTLYTAFVALVKALLYRHTGQDDMVVGAPLTGRISRELEPLVGVFVNTVALRDRVRGDEPFAELMARVRDTILEAQAHQLYPFERLVDDLRVPRDPGRHPLFDVAVEMLDADEGKASPFGPLQVITPSIAGQTSKFDLTIGLLERAAAPALLVEYRTDLFHAASIDRLCEQLCGLLSNVLGRPEAALRELAYLPPQGDVLLRIWEDELARPNCHPDTEFAEPGGMEPAAARICAAVRRSLRVDLTPAELYLYPTVTRLTAYLQLKTGGGLPPAPLWPSRHARRVQR